MKNYEGNKSERDNITALLNSHVQCFNGSVYPNLAKKVSKLKEKSKAQNTQDKYQGDWLKFIEYCKF